MNAHSLVGLFAFNLFLLMVGVALLFGARSWQSWSDLFRLSGFAYMLGVAATGVALVIELVAGLDLSLLSILATGLGLAAASVLAGRALGRSLPPSRVFSGHISLTTAIFGALTIVYSEALFRSGRLAGLYDFDGWAFWVPKAKAIYFYGGLDHQFFEQLPGPSYPPLVPALEAAAFRFMGSPDVVTLHLQFWFFFVGFLGALIGLLAPRVPPLLLWPPILLLAVTPHVLGYAFQEQGDFVLAVAVALTIPWRVFLLVNDLSRGGAEAGGVGLFKHADRAWPSLRLAVSTMFDYDIWLIVAPLMLLAIAAAAVARATRLAVYATLLVGLALAAFTWVTWAFPSLPITKAPNVNPIVRLTGSLALASTALVPLLLSAAWRGLRSDGAS